MVTSTVLPGKTQWRTGKPSRVTASPTTTCGASSRPFFDFPRLRSARQGGVRAVHPLLALRCPVLLIDLEVHRGRVVEHPLHVERKQVGETKVQPLFQRLLVRFEKVHRAVRMVQLQPLASLDAHVFVQPLLMTVPLRRRRAGPVGHHRKQCTFDRKLELACTDELADELRQPYPAPQMFEDMHVPVGPRIEHAPGRVLGDDRFGRAALEDTAGEATQAFGDLGVVAASAVVDDAHTGAFLERVPDTFGDLEMAQGGAIGAGLLGLSQVHVSGSTCLGGVTQARNAIPCIYVFSANIECPVR